jgi:hypothetical protein
MQRLRRYALRLGVIGASVSTLGAGSLLVQRAVAAEPDTVVNACRHSVTGRLRYIAAADTCRPSEKPISWNVQGPAGAEGPAGPAGPPGPKGDPGAGIAELNDLDDLACTRDDGKKGQVDLEIANDGDVTLLCVTDGSPPPPPGDRSLVVNEVDYDQVGTDGDGFVELKNVGAEAIDLDGLALVFVDGADSAEYDREALTGPLAPGAFAVVEVDAQNGAPDGLAIVDTASGALLDALSYEGEITAAMIDGRTYDLVEGAATAAVDSNTVAGSLIRNPDGKDTNDAAADWAFTTTLTKGAANVLTGGAAPASAP